MIKYAVMLSLALMSGQALAQAPIGAKGCVINNPTGVMNVSHPKPVYGKRNEMKYIDSVKGKQTMLYWPKRTLFCQNGAKTTAKKLKGTCQLKPAKNKSGGNHIWKLLCTN